MAPLKKPLSLQNICLDEISHLILNQVLIFRRCNFNIFNEQFKKFAYFIEKYIPNLLRCQLFHLILKRMAFHASEQVYAEPIIFLMKALISHEVRELNFSDLIYGGSVSYDVLDSFEFGIGEIFPYMPKLTSLDLSTHKNEVSLPSTSYNILQSIGWSCPNLHILNLNNNNRVTDDCLLCLAPRKFQQGCPLLEEIYLYECSITSKIIFWLLKEFPGLQKIGYPDMGSILRKYCSSYEKRRYCPHLSLTYFDNTESTCGISDGRLIRLISDVCPKVENVKVRVCDEDCNQLYKLKSLTKLELRFYTGTHHSVGRTTLNYLHKDGRYLSSLSLYCNELTSHHVSAIASTCHKLNKLYLQSNKFIVTEEFQTSSNRLKHLKILSVHIGQHEMDECQFARPLVRYFLESGTKLEELYLIFICRNVNHSFFSDIVGSYPLPNMHTFIYDAPRRNRDFPVIPLDINTALMMICQCKSLITIGNLISWQVTDFEVLELRRIIKKNNYDANVIFASLNKVNTKYF